MQWSNMTNSQAVALRRLLTEIETPNHRQYWSAAHTHDNDHTCVVTEPTELEVQAIAQLMKESKC